MTNTTYSNFSLHRLRDPSPMEPVLPHTYFGQGLSSTVSLVNLCYAPFDLAASLKDRSEAARVGDTEGSFENWIRIIEAPFNISASIGYNLENLQRIWTYLGINGAKWPGFTEVTKRVPILGIVACGIESVYECLGIKEAVSMFKKLGSTSIEEQTDAELLQTLRGLNAEYCQRDPHFNDNFQTAMRRRFRHLSRVEMMNQTREFENIMWGAEDRALIRRVHHRCADKIHRLVPELIRNSIRTNRYDRTEWRAHTIELLQDIKIQSQKKTAMHVIGLIANVITLIGLVAVLCACPHATILALLIIGGILCTARFGISVGMMHTHRWHLDAGNLIPDWVKSIYRTIFARCIPASPRAPI